MTNSMNRITQVLKRSGEVPVLGISEFANWYTHYHADIPELIFPHDNPEKAVTDCIDVHLETGINNLVWNCGRSVVFYQSELENATLQGTPLMKSVLDRLCPLRTALKYAREKDIALLGRLGMNRHYLPDSKPGEAWNGNSSKFSSDYPEYREKSKRGQEISHRLCYAIEEVQRERIDILLEMQRIGVDALVLDYCRQMPVLSYHEALVEPYKDKTGVDPRELDSTRPEAYADWFQYRADILTGFMKKLRKEVAEQEKSLGRNCPIIARVPDSAPWLMIAYGLDVERWYREDLVDGVMLSPFPDTIEDLQLYPEYHIETAHKYGKYVIGGIGSLNIMRSKEFSNQLENSGFYHDKPVYQKVARQYRAGADALSVYQSETLARLDYFKPFLRNAGNTKMVIEKATTLPDPDREVLFKNNSSAMSIGLDWHAAWDRPVYRKGGSLSAVIAGNNAL